MSLTDEPSRTRPPRADSARPGVTLALTDGWQLRSGDSAATAVSVPHDAMIGAPRSADEPSGAHQAWFSGGIHSYRRQIRVPDDAAKRWVAVRFEGVQGAAVVRVGGAEVARWNSPYREVVVPLVGIGDAGGELTLEVDVDHTALPDARWYPGSGLYRDVTLFDLPLAHLVRGGSRLAFRRRSAGGAADITVRVSAAVTDTDEVRCRLVDRGPGGQEEIVGTAVAAPADGAARASVLIEHPRPWSAGDPHLYTLETALIREGAVIDVVRERVGLRTIEVDARQGLRVNGATVLLRGACVHHDNGVIGATTLRAAEFRRVRLLKDAGYNAIRSSHNPASRHLLDACDALGMYVIDELTDIWFLAKTAHDRADEFDESWPDDALSMVRKDRLHPSVIMYSIGNENPETSTARGIRAAGDMTAFLHAHDDERSVTTGLNFMLNAVSKAETGQGSPTLAAPAEAADPSRPAREKRPSVLTSTMINVLANRLGTVTQLVGSLPSAERNTVGVAAALDVVGYNYGWGRYRRDARRHPERVMLGTESFAGDLVRTWPRVKAVPALIGDFTWTGWDYLGEVGLGTWLYGAGSRANAFQKPFPHLVAGCGAIDITGIAGAPVALQRAVWGLADAPEITVRPLDVSGRKALKTAWRSTDAVRSWSWPGHEGERAQIEVYSDADTVELLVNGRSVGRRRAGRRARYVARFTVPYAPGDLTAIASRGGHEVARSTLRSADTSLRLRLRAEPLDPDAPDARYVWAEIADDHGIVDATAQVRVDLDVAGGVLVGFGSAAPAPGSAASFTDTGHETYRGRALAVIRPGGGSVSVTARSTSHGEAALTLSPPDVGTP